jgi:hypothetical protein
VPRREARIGQSRLEVERFCRTFADWLRRRRDADRFSQYASQLDAVAAVIESNLELVRAKLGGVCAAQPGREVYGACLAVDRQLVWMRRFWGYFREKWDQRDDSAIGPVLAAADEVVWSSYAPVFRRLDLPVGPPPLPFVVSDFSASAVPRSRPPADLRPSEVLVAKTLKRLPVSLIGLPESCVGSPWWLIVLPHEVGHQVAFEADGGRVPAAVAELAMTAATEATGTAAVDGEWGPWAHELFADAYACAMVGAAHLWALTEIEGGGDEMLVRRAAGYPPPLVRQAVAAEVLRCYRLCESEAQFPIPPLPALTELVVSESDRLRVERQLAAVPAVARALVEEPTVAGRSLRSLFEPRPDQIGRSGASAAWQQMFAGDAVAQAEQEVDAARLATAGAFAAWADTMTAPDEETRLAQAERLRERMLDVVPYCREEGTRAAGEEEGGADLTALAAEVAREAEALPPEEPAWSDRILAEELVA